VSETNLLPATGEPPIYIDPEEVRQYKERRAARLAVIDIPLLRSLGFVFICLAVYLQDRFLLTSVSPDAWVVVAWICAIYGVVSWAILYAFYGRVRVIDLSLFFLITDDLVGVVALYYAGAERSWLFFFLLAHVADQTGTTFRRAAGFVVLAGACYLGMIWYVVLVDHRPSALAEGAPKLAILMIAGLYVAFSARTAEARRRRSASAFRMARQLIKQLEEQSVELHDARARAEEASSAKSEFLARMTHELRTPLHGILGMVQLAAESDLSPERRRQLELARRSADGLLGTIDDILDFSKIEARRLELEPVPFSLRESIGETMKTLAVTADEKGLDLYFEVAHDVNDAVVGDSLRLRQILINLVGNAIKFTQRGEIVVTVSKMAAPEGETGTPMLLFEVRDTGIGIPEENRQRVFEPFAQADSSMSRRFGGTGLGLAIVSRLVNLMGGSVWIDSEPGKGTAFHFTIRMADDPNGIAPEPGWSAALSGRRVMVVDRKARSRALMETILRSRRMVPILCDSAAAATESMERTRDIDCAVVSVGTAGELVVRMISEKMPMVGLLSPRSALAQHPKFAARLMKPIGEGELIQAVGIALKLRPPAAAQAPAREMISDQPLTILVAEDHPVNQEFAVDAIRRLGHQVMVCANGEEALNLLERQRFDLVLMDIEMPLVDGVEATRRFREWEKKHNRTVTPIVALTAHVSKEEREACLAAGMNGFVAKPVDRRQLVDTIARFVGNDSAGNPLSREQILAAADGNMSLLARVSQAFDRQTPPIMSALRKAIDERDAERVRQQAHKMKGAVSNFPSSPAVEAARQLEEVVGKNADFHQANALYARLEGEIRTLLASIRRVVEMKQ
jgi:two-component system, sensor histidine kinase and response regulator